MTCQCGNSDTSSHTALQHCMQALQGMMLKSRSQKLRFAIIAGALLCACWVVYWVSFISSTPNSVKSRIKVEDHGMFLNHIPHAPKKKANIEKLYLDKKNVFQESNKAKKNPDIPPTMFPLHKSLLADSPGAQAAKERINEQIEERKRQMFRESIKNVSIGENTPKGTVPVTNIKNTLDKPSITEQKDTKNNRLIQKFSQPTTQVKSEAGGKVQTPNDSLKQTVQPNNKTAAAAVPEVDGSYYSLIHGSHITRVHGNIHANLRSMPDQVPKESYIISSSSFPKSVRLRPNIGNGYLGTVIHAPDVFMAGLYNGKLQQSHRAAIPSTVSFNITGTEPATKMKRSYNLDVGRGLYYEEAAASTFNVTQRIYAHRSLDHVLVIEVDLVRSEAKSPLMLKVDLLSKWTSSYDITFLSEESKLDEVSYKKGSISSQETSDSARSEVHVLYDHIPSELKPLPDTLRTKWVFLTAVATKRLDAFRAYDAAKAMIRNSDNLYATHVEAWSKLWRAGHIDIRGNRDLARKTFSSWYYLLSSMPLQASTQERFKGLSPCGLPVGDLNKDYQGRVTSDQELWLFPPLLYYHPDLARLLLLSRTNTKLGAAHNALSSELPGLQYAYESAYTGQELNVDSTKGKRALYTSAGVAFAAIQYLRLTNDTALLTEYDYKEIIIDIAKFIVRLTSNDNVSPYQLKGVLSLDKLHREVNNSGFVNAIATIALSAPKEALAKLGQEQNQFEHYASSMYIPYDTKLGYHKAFDGYTLNMPVHQADTVLLGYPLQMIVNPKNLTADLSTYEKVTDTQAPPTTWAMYTIGWLMANNYTAAAKSFEKQFGYVRDDFQIWTESNSSPDSTVVNYISGAATFLQSLHNGYGGFRLQKDRLDINPVLPPNVTRISFMGVNYLGNSFNVHISKDKILEVEIKNRHKLSGVILDLHLYKTGTQHTLIINETLRIEPQKVALCASNKKIT